MAKVFMCDRCGVYRTDGLYSHRHELTVEAVNPENDAQTGSYELCANCSKAFCEFVANRPTEGK